MMRTQAFYRLTMATLLMICATLTASAQSTDNLLTLQIPFAFQVNEKLLPAGKYAFKRIPTMPKVLIIEGSGASSVMMLTGCYTSSDITTQFSLTFTEYGEQRFLSEVQVAHRDYQYSLVKSKAERRLAETTKARIIHLTPTERPSHTNHTS